VTDTTDLARQLASALGEGFIVERALGEGGFAVVFLVRELSLKRNLAVKVLSPDMITSKTVLERFRREAETVAQLSHPNIVPLYFIGQRDTLLYLAMQCVEGGSLADRLKREGRLPVDDAVRVTCEVASALAHAHKRGVVHRDIKPANILLDPESGRCLVTDFGIARTADATTLTATGMMVGTPAYLSPEQVTGEVSDHRVDIFALGVMLFEMLAGRVPYDAPTPGAALMKRLGGPPESVRLERSDVPEHVAAVITGCLASQPEDRFQSAGEVIRALEGKVVTTGGRETRNVPIARAARTKVRAGVGIMIAIVLCLVGAGWWASRHRAPRDGAVQLAGAPTPLAADAAMVRVAAGDYLMGSDAGPALVRPRHTEHVATFRIERTEVTVGDYARFVAATRASVPWIGTTPDSQLPVTRVPWGDAANYCAWKYPGTGRLPSEQEWEAAARGLEGREYPYGNAAEAARANTASARRSGIAPVGSFTRSTTVDGLKDMSGNVWEWTSSRMRAYPGGAAMSASMSDYRVIRGGAFDTADSLATGWMRGYLKESAPPAELPNTGFRCASS
jgi:formylglycine-generating enzyme required for sulfatase activity/tRNA A-37 threonylcarbamoyl transferase component Bud32